MSHSLHLRWVFRSLLVGLLVALAFGVATLGDAPDAQARAQRPSQFFPVVPLWTHHVEIRVPFRDSNNDGRNDYNPQFNLRSERVAGPGPDDSNDWCPGPPSSSPTLTFRPRVGESGSEVLATYSASLLHQQCQLSTTFPRIIDSGVRGIGLQALTQPGPHITSRSNDTVRITYKDGRETFQPEVSITGFTPADEGTVIRLRFAPERGVRHWQLCIVHSSERSNVWRIDSQGRAVLQQRATLIHRPSATRITERNVECRYEATWPSVRGFHDPAGTHTPPDVFVRKSAEPITGRYVAVTSSDDSTFAPQPNFVVPFTDYNDDGAHDYRGSQFQITYSPASGQPSSCSKRVVVTYEVASAARSSDASDPAAGNADLLSTVTQVDPAEPLMLVDTPHRTQSHCRYDVAPTDTNLVSPQSVERFRRPDGAAAPTSIRASRPEVEHLVYENSPVSRTVTFAVTAPEQASGQTFTATLTDTSGTEGLCSDTTSPVSLAAGTDGRGTAQAELIDYWGGHASSTDRCTYLVTWADEQTEAGGTRFTRVAPAEATIDSAFFDRPAEGRTLANSYSVPVYDATLEVTTNLPVVNDTEFVVTLARTATSDPGCAASLPTQRVTVLAGQASGQTIISDIHQRPPTASPPAFCAYDVEWPPKVGGQIGWVAQPGPPTAGSSIGPDSPASQIARASYFSVFDAVVEASTAVPVGAATTFTVPVNSTAGCSEVDDIEILLEQGHPTGSTTIEELLTLNSTDSTSCIYEVVWPASETSASPSLWRSDLSHDTTNQIDIQRRRVTHRYVSPEASTFSPSISVHVPRIDGPTSGARAHEFVSLFSGAQFTLTFARAPQTHASCSTGTPNSFVFTVQPDGTVTGDGPTGMVDIPAEGSEPCVYLLDASASSMTDGPIRWALQVDSITSRVSVNSRRLNPRTQMTEADAPHVLVDYRVGDISLVPQISIAVPPVRGTVAGVGKNIYSDAHRSDGTNGPLTFDVLFAAASSTPHGCAAPPAGARTFTVQPDGSVVGVAPVLEAYAVLEGEVGFGSSQLARPCVYDVEFPATSGGQSWLTKATDPTDDTQLSAASSSAVATYVGGAIFADVVVRAESPVAQSGSERMAQVDVVATAGAHAGCLVSVDSGAGARAASMMVMLDASGETEIADRLRLVELPVNAASGLDRCVYDVVWSETDLPADDASWVRTVYSQTWPSSALEERLGTPSDIEATYVVPASDDEFEATVVLLSSQPIPENIVFTVGVAPAADAPQGCTASTTEQISVAASTSSQMRRSSVSFELLRRVAGSVSRCVYDVTWPLDEDGPGALFTRDLSYEAGMVLSEIQPEATHRYTTSAEDLPMTARLTATLDERADVATVFSVRVAAPASPLGCSATRDVDVTVGPNRTLGETELTLTRRPAGATTDCVYALTWEPNEDGGTAWQQDAGASPSPQISHDSRDSHNRYVAEVTFFTPTLRFDIPQLDFDDDGQHDYAGAHLAVRFRSPDAACSAVTRAYELDANGRVAPASQVRLVDEHQVRRCSYVVEFPPASTDTQVPLVRSGVAAASPSVSSLAATASASYRETVTRFDATLYLGGVHSIVNEDPINPIPAGTPFTVTVRPQSASLVAAGCDANPASADASITVTIEKSEVNERLPSTQLTSATLVGLIADTADGEHCVYDVDWPASEDTGELFRIYDNPSRPHSSTVRAGSADDVGAVAWYEANSAGAVPLASFFDASVSVQLAVAASADVIFHAYLNAPDHPEQCTSSREVTITVPASQTSGTADIEHLVLRPHNADIICLYTLEWPDADEAESYERDAAFDEQTEVRDGGPDAAARYAQPSPSTVPTTTPGPTSPGPTSPGPTATGRTTTGRTTGGGGGGGRSTTSGAAAAGPWMLTSTRVPVSVTLTTPPQAEFAVGSAFEVLVSSPGQCGDDLAGFDGLAAEIGVLYAVSAVAGAQVDVLAGVDLRLSPYQQRGDQTRPCELRVTLVSAPAGCEFEDAATDEFGRSYVTLDGEAGDDFTEFAITQPVSCASFLRSTLPTRNLPAGAPAA